MLFTTQLGDILHEFDRVKSNIETFIKSDKTEIKVLQG